MSLLADQGDFGEGAVSAESSSSSAAAAAGPAPPADPRTPAEAALASLERASGVAPEKKAAEEGGRKGDEKKAATSIPFDGWLPTKPTSDQMYAIQLEYLTGYAAHQAPLVDAINAWADAEIARVRSWTDQDPVRLREKGEELIRLVTDLQVLRIQRGTSALMRNIALRASLEEAAAAIAQAGQRAGGADVSVSTVTSQRDELVACLHDSTIPITAAVSKLVQTWARNGSLESYLKFKLPVSDTPGPLPSRITSGCVPNVPDERKDAFDPDDASFSAASEALKLWRTLSATTMPVAKLVWTIAPRRSRNRTSLARFACILIGVRALPHLYLHPPCSSDLEDILPSPPPLLERLQEAAGPEHRDHGQRVCRGRPRHLRLRRQLCTHNLGHPHWGGDPNVCATRTPRSFSPVLSCRKGGSVVRGLRCMRLLRRRLQ